MSAPRSRPHIFYPSQLNLYRQCPERYHHKYVLRERVAEEFSRPLAVGIATHELAAVCFKEQLNHGAMPAFLEQRAEDLLPATAYPSILLPFYRDDIASVVSTVKWMLSRFSGAERIVGIERTLSYAFSGNASCDPFTLRAKIDLVVEHPDGTLEHIDFKTGRFKRDPIQEISSRIVMGAAYGRDFPYPKIRSTILFGAEQRVVSETLSKEDCLPTWREIREIANTIMTGSCWAPETSPLCEWCPYFENGCSLSASNTSWSDAAD